MSVWLAEPRNGIVGCVLTLCIAVWLVFAFFIGAGYGYNQKGREVVAPQYKHFHAICEQHGVGITGIGWDAREYQYFAMCDDGHDYDITGADLTPEKR